MQWISEVKYQDARTQTYLGSPSIVRAPDGALLASHDFFGPSCPKNCHGEGCLSAIYRSTDEGLTWANITFLTGIWWGTLFVHAGNVYLIGTSARYGSIVIRRSLDCGFTWTRAADDQSGLLFPHGPYPAAPNYHCAPTPVLAAGGRIYRAFEENPRRNWGPGFLALVISCAEDDNLLAAKSWTMSNKVQFVPEWRPHATASNGGWLEGNVVAAPSGRLWDLMRVNGTNLTETAALLAIEDEGRKLTFNPGDFVHMPGGACKFTVRYDQKTNKYWAVSTLHVDAEFPQQRNVLALFSSPDLRHWRKELDLMKDDTGLPAVESAAKTGFQYVDWQFDGDDIIYLVRAAYMGAHNFHDANRIVFSRIRSFRQLDGH